MFDKDELRGLAKEVTIGIKEALSKDRSETNVKKEIEGVADFLSERLQQSGAAIGAEMKSIKTMQYVQVGTVSLALLLGGTLYVKNQASKSLANMNRVLPAHGWDSSENWIDWS